MRMKSKNSLSMKTRTLLGILAGAAIWCACQKEARHIVKEEIPVPKDSVWISVSASKGEPDAKGLDLINDGATLNTYWKGTETVQVYHDGSHLGTLTVTPGEGEKPKQATLSGYIGTEGLSFPVLLTLRLPRESWSYTGQAGTLASIENSYDYATASVGFNGSEITDNAHFTNVQSIYRFGFKLGEDYLDPRSFTVEAAGGKLVQGLSYEGGVWVPSYGSLTVTPAAAPEDHFYYVSLRNEFTAVDTYSFVIVGQDDALYTASKEIPARVLDVPGKFISAKSISVTKPSFAPVNETLSEPVEVL